MISYFGSKISPNKVETKEGFLICRNVPIARVGSQEYLGREFGQDDRPEDLFKVNRHPEDVFDEAAIASFEGKPVTDLHPGEHVSPENFSNYAKGHIQNVRRKGDKLVADLFINDARLISDIQNKVKVEVSCGYTCDYVEDGKDFKQVNIRGNHVAVVPSGRAGHDVAIQDSAFNAEKGDSPMKKMLKEIFKAFSVATKDASPEEVDELAEVTAEALEPEEEVQDAVPIESDKPEAVQDAVPTEESSEEAVEAEDACEAAKDEEPKAEDLETKIDRLMEMLSSLMSTKDEAVEEEVKPEEAEEKVEDSEEAEVISEGEEEEIADECSAKDASIEFMKKMTPVLNAIKDKNERQKVSDGLLNAIKSDTMGNILTATQDAARVNAELSAKTKYEKMCEDSQAAYNSLNPHKSKKEE